MKCLNLLIFLSTINLFSYSYATEPFKQNHVILITTSKKHPFTSKNKLIYLPDEDAAHALCISMYNDTAHLTSGNPNNPTFIPGQQLEFEKKDILRLKKLIHKPSLFNGVITEKYYEYLSLAIKFKVPFLYASLLNAQLPSEILTLITQKYLCLHDLPNALHKQLCNKEKIYILNNFNNKGSCNCCKKKPRNDYRDNYINWLSALNNDLDKMNTVTLPQALFLSLLCNQRNSSAIIMTLKPSTIGFKECESLLNNNEKFMETICDHQLITRKYELSQRNNNHLVALNFKV